MTHAFRSSFIAFAALALSACNPDAPIGASDDASRSDAPINDASDVPVGDAPRLDVPVTDVPVTDVPVTDVPVGDVPGDRPDACANAIATSDICCMVSMAETICTAVRAGGRPCHVCVQRVDSAGTPRTWSAVESPAECGCAPPFVIPTEDAGTGCTSNGDCPSGQVCEFALGCDQTRGVCHSNGCQSLPVAPQYCGCDGRTIQQVSACLPARAYRSMGACPDAGPVDAGSADASVDVSTDGGGLPLGAECGSGAACAEGLLCCYPCGIPGCVDRCSTPMGGRCPLLP